MDLHQFTVQSDGTLLDAAQKIAKNRSRCVVVMSGRKVVGTVSEGDIVRALLHGANIYSPMRAFIHHGICSLSKHDLASALKLFRQHGVSLIPIISDETELEGLITLQDVLDEVILNDTRRKV